MKQTKYVTISLPEGIAKEIDRLNGILGWWPSRGAFVREACIERITNLNEGLKTAFPEA